jgi:hypothetical protein
VVSRYLPVNSSLLVPDGQRDQSKDRQSMEPGNDLNVFDCSGQPLLVSYCYQIPLRFSLYCLASHD